MNKPTVLIVDDEPANLQVMNQALSGQYRVRAANSGERALAVASTEPYPDLILLDVMMPGMDGFTTIRKLAQQEHSAGVPVIFVTAMDTAQDEERGLAFGAVDYITKPINPAVMLARVHTHLTLKQARDFLHDKNDFLEAEIARRMAENLMVQDASIRALAHLAETRDPETGEHILRTQNYVRTLAVHLKSHPRFSDTISDHFIELVTKSAPLHDIGKVGVPDNILLKPGKLDVDEWKIMQKHAEIGARAIEQAEHDVQQPLEFLSQAKEIALCHHERWDGKGYPQGLSGEDIPVSARLMALADVFDALISRRCYKPAFPMGEAKAIILGERGRQFDPDVTDAFEACFDEFERIARAYQDQSELAPTG